MAFALGENEKVGITWKSSDLAAKQTAGEQIANTPRDGGADFLAVGADTIIDRLAEANVDIDGTALEDALQMRHEFDIARPRRQRAIIAPHGCAMNAGIGDRDRLDMYDRIRRLRQGSRRGTKQRGLDFEQAIAVRGGPLRKQHHDFSIGHAIGDLVHLLARLALLLALDEHALLPLREKAEDRPVAHLGLGDERDVGHCRKDENVEPGRMVGSQHQRPAGLHIADHMDTDTKTIANDAMPVAGQIAPELPVEAQAEDLQWQHHGADDADDRDSTADAQPCHQIICSCMKAFTSSFVLLQRDTVKLQPVVDEFEAVFAGNTLLQSLDLRRMKFDHLTAFQVDQMVVMLFRHGFVAGASIAEIMAGKKAGILEQFYGAIHRGDRNLRIHLHGAPIELFDIRMVLGTFDNARNDPALLGHAHAALGAKLLKGFYGVIHQLLSSVYWTVTTD
ncbi:hypothetical protein RHSP_20313 [Rhizobium freirei PRF 81]|uniref:Uncharacterized protein n=1 Tax=Rhizobium freirei PRF 81 TaxID=363754 RepID=N6UXD9_9HYPH|nr:hypothetical protein RHSP_20313 [Rhizobium freirei PRF 81]